MREYYIVVGLLGLPALFACLDFLKYLFSGETFYKGLTHVIEMIIMIFALAVLFLDLNARTIAAATQPRSLLNTGLP